MKRFIVESVIHIAVIYSMPRYTRYLVYSKATSSMFPKYYFIPTYKPFDFYTNIYTLRLFFKKYVTFGSIIIYEYDISTTYALMYFTTINVTL